MQKKQRWEQQEQMYSFLNKYLCFNIVDMYSRRVLNTPRQSLPVTFLRAFTYYVIRACGARLPILRHRYRNLTAPCGKSGKQQSFRQAGTQTPLESSAGISVFLVPLNISRHHATQDRSVLRRMMTQYGNRDLIRGPKSISL